MSKVLPASALFLTLVRTDPKHLQKDRIAGTAKTMVNILHDEWAHIIHSPDASRLPVVDFLQNLTGGGFASHLLQEGLTELLISCLEPIPYRSFPEGYGAAIVSVANLLLLVPLSKIPLIQIGELRMLYRNVQFDLLPKGNDIVERAKRRLANVTNEPSHYYSEEEILDIYGISKPAYKRSYQKYCTQKRQMSQVFDNFATRVTATGGKLPYGEQSGFARLLGHSESTVRGWKASILADENWRPWNSDRSMSRRLFDDETEAEITKFIKES